MMDLSRLDEFVEANRVYFANATERDSEAGVGPLIGVWKDDEPLVWLWPNQGDADTVLSVAWPAIIALEPDSLTVSLDTYHAGQGTKADGTPWEKGEMQKAAQEGTADAELVQSAMLIYIFNRLGDAAAVSTFYEVIEGKIQWGEEVRWGGDDPATNGTIDGYIPDVIRQAFEQPTLRDRIKETAKLGEMIPDLDQLSPENGMNAREAKAYFDENPEEAYAAVVSACVKTQMLDKLAALAIGANNSKIAEYLAKSLSDIGEVYRPEDL